MWLFITTKTLLKIGAFAHRSWKMRRLFLTGFIVLTAWDEYKRKKRFENKNNDKIELL